jgi:hypothetical protein
MDNIFRYDLATWNGPRVILVTDNVGKRSTVPLLGYVVLPSASQAPLKGMTPSGKRYSVQFHGSCASE